MAGLEGNSVPRVCNRLGNTVHSNLDSDGLFLGNDDHAMLHNVLT